MRRRGVEMKIVLAEGPEQPRAPDPASVGLLSQAHRFATALKSGAVTSITELADGQGLDRSDVSHILALAWLAPDVTTAIREGRQPLELTVTRLKRFGDLPPNWADQHALLDFSRA